MKYYTGIGSRQTPKDVLGFMAMVAKNLGHRGYTLRSGGAAGADDAFEAALYGGMKREIFIPWNGFAGWRENDPGVYNVGDHLGARMLAKQYHPNWAACSPGARALHTRNMFQILGQDLNSPSDFVVCWTPGAKGSGGTGQALRLAKDVGIPVYDIADEKALNRLRSLLVMENAEA